MSSVALAVVSIAAGLFDVFVHRPWVAAVQLAMAAAFLLLLLRAELESWRFDGTQLVRRTFSLWRMRFRETRLGARSIRGIGVARAAGRARAWVETRHGDQYALVEGDEQEVERIAEVVRGALQLPAPDAPARTLN